MLVAVMWTVLAISVLTVVAAFGGLAVVELRARLGPPASWKGKTLTTESCLVVFLVCCAYVLMFVGGVCGVVLASLLEEGSPARAVVTVIWIVLFAGAALATVQLLRQFWLNRRRDRLSK